MVYMLSLPMGTRNTAIKPNRRGFVGMIAVPTRDAEGVGAMPTVAEVRKLSREALLAGTDDFLFIKPKTATHGGHANGERIAALAPRRAQLSRRCRRLQDLVAGCA